MTLTSIFNLWGKWNLRGSVILSFSLQVFLTLFASFRKKTANPCMYYVLWLAYLAADSVAIFAIGLISCGQCNLSADVPKVDKAVQAFWASFLFLHLGGPDTLTAFSLEDSSLWKRHLLGYITQVGLTISLFVQIFLGNRPLLSPTMMVFLAGNIKFVERTLALYLSSLPKLRRSMVDPRSSRRLANYWLNKEINAPYEYSNEEDAKLAERAVVMHAYCFFELFKLCIVDLIYRSDDRTVSREYFRRVSAMDALRVISTELHFFHEMLHTKALAIHSKLSYFFRSVALTLLTVAFVQFIHSKKHGLSGLDVKITYILLSGGIALDVTALLMLLFSDWTIAEIMVCEGLDQQCLLSAMIDTMKKPRFAKCKANANANLTYVVPHTLFIFRRWSETISACNLFSECFKESPRKMYECDQRFRLSNILIFPFRMVGKVVSCFHQASKTIVKSCCTSIRRMYESENPFIRILSFPLVMVEITIVSYFTDTPEMIENTKHVSENPFICKLWNFIFQEVKRKSEDADDLEKVRGICEARGNLFPESLAGEIEGGKFPEYLTEASYDTSIFVWHIATEICYNTKDVHVREGTVVDQTLVDKREFSKILSDYMLYLLLNQPKVMSVVANVAQITSYQIIKQICRYRDDMSDHPQNVEQLCKRMIEDGLRLSMIEDGLRLSMIENDCVLWRSLLGMGIRLACEMDRLEERKWKVMRGVWVEILSYAAIHIKGETHMQVLSQGGELLAFVWLLMLHFGLFYKAEWGIVSASWTTPYTQV